MSKPVLVQLCAYSLLFLLLAPAPALDQQSPVSTSPIHLDRQTLLNRLSGFRVIYLGETHDSVADHQAQLEIIQVLYRQNPRLTLGLEMFQRPFQAALDGYLRGELTEMELLEQSEYAQRWGFPWRFYAPILRFAKENKIPVLALNTPSEVTRKVAREGLQSLSAAERKFIPPLSEIDLGDALYREKIRQIYTQIHEGRTASSGFEQFFQAQVLWDETMAAVIADYLQANPQRQVVVLAGKGHIAFGHGIPSRVARRLDRGQGSVQVRLKQAAILLNPEPELEQPGAADFIWRSP